MDLFDESIARHLSMKSKLGKCLDMFTDRVGTIIINMRIFLDTERKETFYDEERTTKKVIISIRQISNSCNTFCQIIF